LQHDKKVVFVDTNDERREDRHFVNTGEVTIIKHIVEGCRGSIAHTNNRRECYNYIIISKIRKVFVLAQWISSRDRKLR
jgi:hypothetical protein